MECLVFRSAGAYLALDVLKIDELLLSRDYNIKDLDYMQRIHRNGEDIPLRDLCPDIVTSNRPIPDKFTIIVCKLDKKTALIADSAVEIIKIDEDAVQDTKSADVEITPEYLSGVYEQDDKKIHIIDPAKLSQLVKSSE